MEDDPKRASGGADASDAQDDLGDPHDLRILVVDDDPTIRGMLLDSLRDWKYEVQEAHHGAAALDALHSGHRIDLIVSDLQMPEMSGMDLLKQARRFDPDLPFVMMTSFGEVQTAVEAMRLGAHDYVSKPINLDEFRCLIERVEQTTRLRCEVKKLRVEIAKEYSGGARAALVGNSPSMREIAHMIQKLSQNKTTVYIYGESGTGKELVARAIHYSGITNDQPFLAVNCGGMSASLLESQIFGHVKGAYTGAHSDHKGYFRAAEGGTLLLDEITEMDIGLQVKLLRVLQEREVIPVGSTKPIPVDVRVIAASNRDAEFAVREGRLRQDLFYRLNVVRVDLSPLRERRGDIPDLVNYFNNRFSSEYGVSCRHVSSEALDQLAAHSWPGNVRELENILARAFALSEEDLTLPDDFSARVLAGEVSTSTDGAAAPLPEWRELERTVLAVVMKESALEPGKARELRASLLEMADLVARSAGLVTEAAQPTSVGTAPAQFRPPGEETPPGAESVLPTLMEGEKRLIEEAMSRSGGVKARACALLDVEPRRFNRLLMRHGLE